MHASTISPPPFRLLYPFEGLQFFVLSLVSKRTHQCLVVPGSAFHVRVAASRLSIPTRVLVRVRTLRMFILFFCTIVSKFNANRRAAWESMLNPLHDKNEGMLAFYDTCGSTVSMTIIRYIYGPFVHQYSMKTVSIFRDRVVALFVPFFL